MIVALTFGLRIGGAERLLVDWLVAMKARPEARAVLIVVNRDCDAGLLGVLERNGVEVLLIGRRPGSWSVAPMFALLRCLWRLKPAILHAHDYAAQVVAIAARLLLPGTRIFTTVHNVHEAEKFPAWYRWAARALKVHFIAISAAVASDCKAHGLQTFATIENGIQLEPYRKIFRNRGFGAELRIICVARLFPRQKGQDILLRALQLCRKRGIAATCRFLGGSSQYNAAGRRQLTALAEELGLSASVAFVMDEIDMAAALDQSNLFVLPSRYEGFGIAIIEAMGAGLPVIASAVDGIPEIIQDGVSGFLVPAEDPDALALKIAQVAAAADLAPLIAAAAARAEAYSIEAMRDRYLEAYARSES